MALIQCTKKLLKELGLDKVKDNLVIMNDINSKLFMEKWHANVLIIERRKAVLFSNDVTLFSFLVPKLLKADFQNLKSIFIDNLISTMIFEGLEEYTAPIIQNFQNNLYFTKSSSRSVLGSLNDMRFMIEHYIYDNGGLENTTIHELNKMLNKIPFRATQFIYPIEAMRTKLNERAT